MHSPASTKISKLDFLKIFADQNIVWLEVPVENSIFVKMVNSSDDAKHNFFYLENGHLSIAVFDEGVQIHIDHLKAEVETIFFDIVSCYVLEEHQVLMVHTS